MKNILLVVLVAMAIACNNTPRRVGAKGEGGGAAVDPKQLRIDNKRKIDSLKKAREAAIMSGKISPKEQMAISDTIIKLQIQIDSLDRLKTK